MILKPFNSCVYIIEFAFQEGPVMIHYSFIEKVLFFTKNTWMVRTENQSFSMVVVPNDSDAIVPF